MGNTLFETAGSYDSNKSSLFQGGAGDAEEEDQGEPTQLK